MSSVPKSISNVTAIRAISGSLLALCTVAVAARFWARHLQKGHFQADDWLVIPAWITFVGLCACLLESTYIHTLGLTPEEAAPFHPSNLAFAKIELTMDEMLALSLGFTKLSALFFFKRVFCIPKFPSTFKTALNIVIVAVVCWTVAFIIFPLALCGDHLYGYWDRPVFNQYCPAAHPYLISGGATDLFFELVVISLPSTQIWALPTTLQKKLATTLVFLTAFLSLGASIARLVIVVDLATHPITDAAVAALVDSAVFTMWTLEAGAGILAVNMPLLWYYYADKRPGKILRSLRGLLSLRSANDTKLVDRSDRTKV